LHLDRIKRAANKKAVLWKNNMIRYSPFQLDLSTYIFERKQDKHFKELDKSGRLKSFHPTFEALYRLIIMKKKERDRDGNMEGGAEPSTLLTIFDRLC
jgi:hypothetical protein